MGSSAPQASYWILGYGYVGSRLATLLGRAGESVTAVKRHPREAPETAVDLLALDLAERELPVPSRPVAGIVYCLAPSGGGKAAYAEVYGRVLAKVLAWSVRYAPEAPFILTSSTGVYADLEGALSESMPLPTSAAPASSWYLAKAEALVLQNAGRPYVVRLAGLYGPGRTRMFEALHRSPPHDEAASAYLASTLNLIHREDAARLLLHLLWSRPPAGVYNGVDDAPTQRGAILEWILAKFPDFYAVQRAPYIRPSAALARGDRRCQNTKIRTTGFLLHYPDFRVGLRSILAQP